MTPTNQPVNIAQLKDMYGTASLPAVTTNPWPCLPIGGRLGAFIENWQQVTGNPFILDVVANGLRFELTEWPQARASRIYRLPNNERLGLLTALAEFRKENACHRIDRAHLPNNHII